MSVIYPYDPVYLGEDPTDTNKILEKFRKDVEKAFDKFPVKQEEAKLKVLPPIRTIRCL